MSDYKGEWQAAKTRFEESSGVKKPAPTKKNLFGKAVRQKVGIAEAFGKVDKLMPEDDGETMREKDLEKLGPLVSTAGQEVRNYLKLLTDAIDNEKEEHGKGADAIYRDLKILKAELESMTAKMKAKLDRIYAVRRAESEGLSQRVKMFLTNFRTMKTSIDKNGKQALAVVQQLLKDPTVQNFNSAFPKAARDLTQNIGQIHKFTLPEELNPDALRTRGEALEDPQIAEAVEELEKRVAHFKRETIPLMRETGTTPMDSTLAKFCNSPIRFEEGASKEDVIEATRNFGRQVKKALELGQKMI
jgi:hypothetical protein